MVLLIIFLWPNRRMFQQDYCECDAVRCTIIPKNAKLKRNNKNKPNQKETGNILHKIRCVFIGFLFDKTIFLPQGRQQHEHIKSEETTKQNRNTRNKNQMYQLRNILNMTRIYGTVQHREREISFASSYKFTDEKAEVAKILSVQYEEKRHRTMYIHVKRVFTILCHNMQYIFVDYNKQRI